MQKITFTENLAHNIALMQSVFEGDDTFIVREATGRNGLHCAMFFFDGMVDSFTINESLVRPVLLSDRRRASADELAGRILQADDCRVETDIDKALAAFLYGDTLVLTEGDARPLVVNTKGFARRSPEEPENERVLSGPREGFTECFMPNLALIRRRVRDTRLKFNFLRVGGRTNTAVCLCYIDGLCPAPLVDEMRTRLSVLELDSVLDANYIAECLCDHRFSPFPTLGTTERPDVAASRLLEGRCALVVDGSPVVLTAPHLLQECFQSNDDYYISFLRTNVSRVLRTLGFLCSVTIPAVYTALLLYHRELVPARLLFAVTAAQRGVPLPVGWEVLLLLIVLEVLREAGARTPGAMGQTMSIVGGLGAVFRRPHGHRCGGGRCDRTDGTPPSDSRALAAVRPAWGGRRRRSVRRGTGALAHARPAVPHELVRRSLPHQPRAARRDRFRGCLAARAVVPHEIRPFFLFPYCWEEETMKKLLLLLPLALLCGCAREPSPVSALALDRAGNGCRLTAELVRQDTPEDAAVPSCLAAQGDSFTDALHALEGLLPGELYLSHAQVLLLSEQAAEDDLTPLAEYLCRDNDIRLNLRCAVVRGGAASDLLENDEEIYALSDLLDRAAETGTLPDMPLYRVTEALETDGTAILPSLSLDRFGQTAPSGTAVFTEGKLSCFLDGGMIGGERFA